MEIIYDGWPDGNQVLVDSVKVTYLQDHDNVSSEDDIQELTLETRDGGGGKYINIHTNEYGWSISDEKDLIPIFKHFKSIYEDTSNS